jgi:integrase
VVKTQAHEYGSGSVSKRGDGRYVARYKGRSYYGTTESAAWKKIEDAKSQVAAIAAPSSGMRLGDYLISWLDSKRGRITQVTYDGYSKRIRTHLDKEPLRGIKLTDLTTKDVEAYIERRIKDGAAPGTVISERRVLCAALQDAMSKTPPLITINPAKLAKPPHKTRRKVKAFPVSRARDILKACEGHWLEPMVTLAIYTGMRQEEILGLRWSDVDFGRATLHVSNTLTRPHKDDEVGNDGARVRVTGTMVVFGEPKTDTSEREISLQPEVVAQLQSVRIQQEQDKTAHRKRMAKGGTFSSIRLVNPPLSPWGQDLVFTTKGGQPRNGTTITHELQKRINAARLPWLTFRDLRHCYATLQLGNGVPIAVVSKSLGHSTIAITMDTYGHLLTDAQKEAQAGLSALLNGAKG